MSCFPCFQSQKSKKLSESKKMSSSDEANVTRGNGNDQASQVENGNIKAQNFTFRELASATKNFKQECLLGEGGFGKVYKGMLHPSGQVVTVKQLDRNGLQENNIQTFMAEISTVSILQHPNLVNLIGYCADGDQRLLVYEYMPGGSVEAHLLDKQPEQKALDWKTRMKIAYGAAQGLEYLHDKANPAVVYHGLKPSNILMDEKFNPKLSDFGLAKLNPCGEKNHVSLITYGYSAPEYGRNGTLTTKSDVYSYGIVLLEIITGRRAVDTTKPVDEQNLVAWAQPMLRDPKRFPDMADPHLNKQFPEKSLNQAVAIAAMCVQEEPTARPLMSDVVTALSFLTAVEDAPSPVMPPVMSEELNKKNTDNDDSESSDDEDEDSVYEDGMSEESGGGDGKSKKWGSKSSHKSRSKEGSNSSKGSLKKKTKKYFSLSR